MLLVLRVNPGLTPPLQLFEWGQRVRGIVSRPLGGGAVWFPVSVVVMGGGGCTGGGVPLGTVPALSWCGLTGELTRASVV